jgi:catechol 2,3-dioxygenase-like lactoylglutathione lyase family enzyme
MGSDGAAALVGGLRVSKTDGRPSAVSTNAERHQRVAIAMGGRWITKLVVVVLLFKSLDCFPQTPQLDGIAHIALRVSDLDSSRNFFRRLGFEESFSLASGGTTKEVFVKINDRQFIELYPRVDAHQALGWMHVCYESDSLNDLNSSYAARRLKPSPVVKAGAGNLIFSLKDPEERVVEFTQYMPGSLHFVDRGKHLGEHRISNELIGIRISTPDLALSERFYKSGLGFDEQHVKSGLRMRISSNSHQWIELDHANAIRQIEFWMLVSNPDEAAHYALEQGFAVRRKNRVAFIDDPDGNTFAFTEDH